MFDQSGEHVLESLDQLDVAAGCAALHLHAPNADDADRLSSLSATALACGSVVPGKPVPWRELLIAIGEFHRGPRWDAHETAWVEPVAFHGGQYSFFTGGSPENVFHLRHVLRAVFLADGVGPPHVQSHLMGLSTAAVRLSNHLVTAGRGRRYEIAPLRSDSGPLLPEPERFNDLLGAVDLSESRLRQIIGKAPSVLGPLVHDLDRDGPLGVSSTTGAPLFDLHPIVRRGERYVVAGPANLAVALRHALVAALLEEGVREALTARLWEATLGEVLRSCERMDWRLQAVIRPERSGALGGVIFAFDVDKAAVVTVVGDDLQDYDSGQPESLWNAFAVQDDIESVMRSAESQLFYGPPVRPNEILHIALLAGCGRPAMFGLQQAPPPVRAPRIILSAEALHTISLAGTDECEIWKFARASGRLSEQAHTIPAGPLDEYAAWRDNEHSFYFGDEGRPTLIMFDPSHGRALRERVASERDLHAAVTPEGSITEVIRVHADPAIPIYLPLSDLGAERHHGPRMLVEDGQVPIWVTSDANAAGNYRIVYAQLVDCLAYWLWQISPSLPSLPPTVEGGPLKLALEIEAPDAWETDTPPGDQGPVATIESDPDAPGLRIVVHAAMVARLNQADNAAERELVRILLAGFGDLAVALGAPAIAPAGFDEAVERHAPLGPKKKINLMRDVTEVAMVGDGLPSYRRVQNAEVDELLDRVGPAVCEHLDLDVGLVPADRRSAALNLAVEHHFEDFAGLIVTLDPDSLLETLVAAHEAALNHEAVFRRTFAARAACFNETKLVEDMRKEIPLAADTSIALRFTIEYVVAQPPRGFRPLSLDLLDRVLALASQITNRGMASDIIRYELDDLSLSVLPSGRLGVDGSKGYYRGQQAYLDAVVPGQARAARERYAEPWTPRESGRTGIADELDAAAHAEWGLTMTELAQLHGELVAGAGRRSMAVSSAPRAELLDELARALEVDRRRIERGINMLTLEPRARFRDPPSPFAPPDVYPWRFNRELSFVRRPLLLRTTGDGEELVWGPRHVDAAGRQLVMLIMSERLKAHSKPMHNLMTRLRQEETAEFVEHIGRQYSDAGMVVRTNVRKIAGHKITKLDGNDAGDIDVLAADPVGLVVHVQECKDLEGARTPAELHNELEKTFAVGRRKRSAADKHLERIAWVEDHLAEVIAWLGLPVAAGRWSVAGGFVVDTEVLSPHVYDCPLAVTPVSRLPSGLGAAADPEHAGTAR